MNNQEINNIPLTNIINSSLIDLPSPSSISFIWNIGFLLGITLTLQIVSGLILSIHYTSDTATAFQSTIHIIRDVSGGWPTRFLHINGASLFFILIYIHTARGIYFGSPSNNNAVWTSGLLLILATIAAAFFGYVLPWGQMSFWGATVITNLFSAIPLVGNDLVQWLWGNFSVSQPTLNRFFSLHFITPIAIAAIVILHLIALHETGSSNPTGSSTNSDNINFHPNFMINDIIPIVWISIALLILISNKPDLLGDVENLNPANPLVTPVHIQPEWYFLFAYAILRSIPSNLGGVVALAASVAFLLVLINSNPNSINFNPINNANFWTLIAVTSLLTWIGANPVEPPYENIGQVLSGLYFTILSIICFLNSPWKPTNELFLEN